MGTARHTLDALRARNIQRLFHLLRQWVGASQTRLAIACGLTQGKVSEIMAGTRRVIALDVFERIADGLDMPADARLALGLAPLIETAGSLARIPSRDGSLPPSPLMFGPPDDQAEDPMRRRTFTRLAGTSLLGSVLADTSSARGAITSAEAFAAAFARHSMSATGSEPANLAALTRAVVNAKRSYQDCRYSEVLTQLPKLLSDLQAACESLDGDQLLRAYSLSADAYHVAASILLKLDDHGLAWVAADRSMRAATMSEDPLTIGSSARIVTHALMADGHYAAAVQTASSYSEQLASAVKNPTPDSRSVYGSLLLRGTLAAGMAENRGAAASLLDEARDAGSQLGGDFNHRWTAFGPANVMLHRINIAISLGDAGVAIEQARKVNLDWLPITERKASFLIDTARAFAQWGKHEQAYQALRAAEQLAPQEVGGRPAVRLLVGDLLATAPLTTRPHLRDLADRIGTVA